ncbi:MAG: hypothetical protein HY814_03420 [Candidatus Riflebacteria bacterium]|nr:hypothetical protein [Candidatus Riflebacteria bacterium]
MQETLERVRRWLVSQNCWYLLSGFLMLLGCFLMSQAPGADSVELGAGLKLQSVVLVYQVLVVVLAVWVRRKLGVENDAFNLACVALVLLPDPTFFSTRFWGHSTSAGQAVNGTALIASVLMLIGLVEGGRFPIGRRSLACWLVTLMAVFSAGALMEPGAGAHNAVSLDVLVFLPLVLAALAAPWGSEAVGNDAERNVPTDRRLAKHPVLWGNPGNIYRTYLAAIVLFYPFVVVLRHLYGLAAVFGQDLTFLHLAPALLGAGVLAVKASPANARRTGAMGGLCVVALIMAGIHDESLIPARAGMPFFQLMLVAVTAFNLWLHSLTDRRRMPALAVCCLLTLISGGTPASAAQAICELRPALLAALVSMLMIHALRDGGFWEIFRAGAGAWLLLCRVAPISEGAALFLGLHGLGFLYLACVHLYPRKDLYWSGPTVAALLLISLLPGLHGSSSDLLFCRAAMASELTILFILGCNTVVGSYLFVAVGFGVFEAFVMTVQYLPRVDLAKLFWSWGGPAAVTLAFAALGLGLLGTRERSAGRM